MTCWDTFTNVLNAGVDRVILYGPPGTGKTYSALNEVLPGQRSFRLTCTDDMTNADVTGAFMPSADGGFQFIEGAAVKAWRAGGRLVIDEIDKAGGDVFATLLNMTDSSGSSVWEHPVTGERLSPANGFTVVMTTNVETIGELPEALIDRFPMRLRINQPHPGGLATLPYHWRGYAARMADAAPGQRMSLRAFQSLSKLAQTMGEEAAAELILGNRAAAFLEAIRIDRLELGAER